jgi:tRNA (mo5U34)-methyltransferase
MIPAVSEQLDVERLRAEVAGRQWYHTLELAPGVVTPGWFDTRAVARTLPIPQSLAGQRCLDVGTFDGFWAFELERRGAAEVVAVDLLDARAWDWPANSPPAVVDTLAQRKRGGEGFHTARRALRSRVELLERSVYDLDPADIGRFDFVYVGSLLLHLRDPVRAVERILGVCSGRALFVEVFDPLLTLWFRRRPVATLDADGRPWWWQSNLACVVRIVEAAGFALLERPRRLRMPPGAGHEGRRPRVGDLRDRRRRRDVFNGLLGDPHVALLAAAAPAASPA